MYMEEFVVLSSENILDEDLIDRDLGERLGISFEGNYEDVRQSLEQISRKYPTATIQLCCRSIVSFFDVWEDTFMDGTLISTRSFWQKGELT